MPRKRLWPRQNDEFVDLETLKILTSDAIRRAEGLADVGSGGAEAAYLDVSLLEDRVARLTSPSTAVGALARQGAVGSAVLAGATERAEELVISYSAEEGASEELRDELTATLTRLVEVRRADRADAIRERFPCASARYGAEEIVRLAEAIVCQAEPLPIG